ncbi:MAG TPA: DUF2637 domain-containing protein [Streptosporangiaceae bacterium]|nr:DUF2637 domain-containing protein [Streptosporangiaceae bacterium]
MSTTNLPRGPGLFEITHANGESLITNVRRLAGAERAPGSALIAVAAWLLAALGGGLLFVSFAGQFRYIFLARHESDASLIEALMFDVGMIIFSLLALGLARAGKAARTERTLIMACSFGSAAMNYAAADTASPRSVIAYVAAPVFLAVVVDRVIAVIRRHVLGDDEASAWTALGRAVVAMVRFAGLVLLYSLRTVLAPRETSAGLRRMVLDAAPLPGVQAPEEPQAIDPPTTKKAALLALYRMHPEYGVRASASKVAAELAPQVDLSAGTARAYVYAELEARAS